ncbi:hypothetical protein ACWEPL_19030 [Nonomuraea sp. NPDC004186]
MPAHRCPVDGAERRPPWISGISRTITATVSSGALINATHDLQPSHKRLAGATTELLTFHKRIHVALPSTQIKRWPYYLPGKWIPHCTLALGLDRAELSKAMNAIHGYEPMVATVSGISITETSTGTVTPLIP